MVSLFHSLLLKSRFVERRGACQAVISKIFCYSCKTVNMHVTDEQQKTEFTEWKKERNETIQDIFKPDIMVS